MLSLMRVDTFIARNNAGSFEGLTLGRKHQMVASLAMALVEAVQPQNENIEKIKEIVTPRSVDWEAYTLLSDLICVAFVEIKPRPTAPSNQSEPIAPVDPNDIIPF